MSQIPPIRDFRLARAYNEGWRHARHYHHRPCLGTLVRGWGYDEAEALFFALGFAEAKHQGGHASESRCGCK